MATMIGYMPDEISKVIHDFIRPKLDERFVYTIEWSLSVEVEELEEKTFYIRENADAYHNKIMKLPNHKKPLWTSYKVQEYNEECKCWDYQQNSIIYTHFETCDNCNSLGCNIKYYDDDGDDELDFDIIECRYCGGDFCVDCCSSKPRRYREFNNCCLNCCENQSIDSDSSSDSDSDY